MFRLFTVILAIAAIVWLIDRYRTYRRDAEIGRMTPDDLVEAIIRREISVLEVPSRHRETVSRMLAEIQSELDSAD